MQKKKTKINWATLLLTIALLTNTAVEAMLIQRVSKLESKQEIQQAVGLVDMKASAYSVTDFPGKAALGDKPKCGRDVAVSRDRLDLLGKRVYIREKYGDALGIYTVVDIMRNGPSNTIDILVPDRKHATDFGRKEVEVYVIHN